MTTPRISPSAPPKPLSPALDTTFKIGLVLKGLRIGPVSAPAAMAASSPYPPPGECSVRAAGTPGRALAAPALVTPDGP